MALTTPSQIKLQTNLAKSPVRPSPQKGEKISPFITKDDHLPKNETLIEHFDKKSILVAHQNADESLHFNEPDLDSHDCDSQEQINIKENHSK